MNILVEGSRPFRLDRADRGPRLPGRRRRAPRRRPGGATRTAGAAARRAYADLVEQVTDARPSEADLAELDAYGMASTIAFDAADKQGHARAARRGRPPAPPRDLCAARSSASRHARAAERAAPTAGRTADGARRVRAAVRHPRSRRRGLGVRHDAGGHQRGADADRADDRAARARRPVARRHRGAGAHRAQLDPARRADPDRLRRHLRRVDRARAARSTSARRCSASAPGTTTAPSNRPARHLLRHRQDQLRTAPADLARLSPAGLPLVLRHRHRRLRKRFGGSAA